MANPEHLAILKKGSKVWNEWRSHNSGVHPDFSGADLRGHVLMHCHLYFSDFSGADLRSSILSSADLSESIFNKTDLSGATLGLSDLYLTTFTDSNLDNTMLFGANLSGAKFIQSTIRNSDLTEVNLVATSFSHSDISGSRIHGINAWKIIKEELIQKDLIITAEDEPEITVDEIEVAQFIYLLLNNQNIRNAIEAITSKAVLILGRFTEERKKILDAIRDELRQRNYLPILFDFEKPATRDLTETISILAKLSRYVIADLTDAKSIPQELSHIIADMPSLPVIPIIVQGYREYGMYEHWKRYPWVLPIYEYGDEAHLLLTLADGVIEPVERKVQEVRNS